MGGFGGYGGPYGGGYGGPYGAGAFGRGKAHNAFGQRGANHYAAGGKANQAAHSNGKAFDNKAGRDFAASKENEANKDKKYKSYGRKCRRYQCAERNAANKEYTIGPNYYENNGASQFGGGRQFGRAGGFQRAGAGYGANSFGRGVRGVGF